MSSSIHTRRRVSGFSFIELIIVIAVIGGLVAFAMTTGDTVQRSGRVQQAVQAVSSLESAIHSTYSSQVGYPGLDNTAIYETVPTAIQGPSNPSLGHAWDASGISVSGANGGDNFSIEFASLPEAACENLANNFLGGFEETSVNGTPVTDPGDVAASCSGSGNTITWIGA